MHCNSKPYELFLDLDRAHNWIKIPLQPGFEFWGARVWSRTYAHLKSPTRVWFIAHLTKIFDVPYKEYIKFPAAIHCNLCPISLSSAIVLRTATIRWQVITAAKMGLKAHDFQEFLALMRALHFTNQLRKYYTILSGITFHKMLQKTTINWL